MHLNRKSGGLKIMGFLRVLLTVATAGAAAFGQPTAAGKLTFEVASVRRSPPDSRVSPRGIEISGDRVHIGPIILANLIGAAYGVPYYRIQGPAWLTEPHALFEVIANVPSGTDKSDVPEMLQNLLAERFALSAEVGSMQADGVVLTVAKTGHKLHQKVEQGDTTLRTKDADGRVLMPFGAARLAIGDMRSGKGNLS